MTRDEHMKWCKDRAMEYVRSGDLTNAVASMISDLNKRPDTELKAATAMLGMFAAQQAVQGDRDGVQRFILGFN